VRLFREGAARHDGDAHRDESLPGRRSHGVEDVGGDETIDEPVARDAGA